jgi:hypothetical protein
MHAEAYEHMHAEAVRSLTRALADLQVKVEHLASDLEEDPHRFFGGAARTMGAVAAEVVQFAGQLDGINKSAFLARRPDTPAE